MLTSADGAVRARFTALHQVLARASDPSLAKTLEVRLAGTTLFAVRTPLGERTLADHRGLLDLPSVAALGAALAPAILAAGPATRGTLRAADVGFDARGRPVLAPRVEPLPRDTVFAPEARGGQATDGVSGLYGLGVVLYELTTGRSPVSAPGRPPPPSTARADVPPWLDEAILRLLAPQPSERIAAVALLEGKPKPSAPRHPTLAPPPPAPSGAPRGDPRALVVVPARTLLDPARRSLVAGLAGLPCAAVDHLIARRLPIVVEASAAPELARARAAELTRAFGVPFVAAHAGGAAPFAFRALAGLVALLPLGVAGLTFLIGLWPLSFVSALAAWGVWWLGGVAARGASGGAFRGGIVALGVIRAARSQRGVDGSLATEWRRLSELRVEVARADLPAVAASDLRDSLRGLEAALEAVAGRGDDVEQTRIRAAIGELAAAVAQVGADASDARLRSLGQAITRARAADRS